jgi:hypothetical protein
MGPSFEVPSSQLGWRSRVASPEARSSNWPAWFLGGPDGSLLQAREPIAESNGHMVGEGLGNRHPDRRWIGLVTLRSSD